MPVGGLWEQIRPGHRNKFDLGIGGALGYTALRVAEAALVACREWVGVGDGGGGARNRPEGSDERRNDAISIDVAREDCKQGYNVYELGTESEQRQTGTSRKECRLSL